MKQTLDERRSSTLRRVFGDAIGSGLRRNHSPPHKTGFATALRQLGDHDLAEDVTQHVFIALAQKAPSLKLDRTVAGWLYQTTVNQARQRLRSELRRRNREQIAAAAADSAREGESIWAMLIPLLDEALLSLPDTDRLAVVLHFMEQRPFREVGSALGVGEDAARKRVHRAVGDLTAWFRQRGILVPGTTMVAALSLEGVSSISINAAALLTQGWPAASSSAALTGSLLSPLMILMKSTQAKFVIILVASGIALTSPFLLRDQSAAARPVASTPEAASATESTPREENRVPLAPSGGSEQAPARPRATALQKSFLERLNEGDMSLSMLPREEADRFLALNRTNAQSLLAAFRVTHDLEYLRRAATSYPDDPSVLFRAIAHDAFPENRRQWLDQFKQADPENALAYYLSADQYRKENDADSMLQELAQASRKSGFQDYVTDHMQSLEEIYLSAGHTAAESKALATHAVELPYIAQLSEMSKSIADSVGRAQQSGDSASVDSLSRMGLKLAGSLHGVQDGGNLLGQIVGLKVEQRILEQLDQNQAYPFLNGSAGNRLAAVNLREQAIRQDSQFVEQWLPNASEQEQVSYFDRLKLYGESAAIEWLKNRTQSR